MNNVEKANNDMVTCGGGCSLKDRKKNHNKKGEDFKTIGSFHTDPIIELIQAEKSLLQNEFENCKPNNTNVIRLKKEINDEETLKIENERLYKENSFLLNPDNLNLNNGKELKKLFMHDSETIYLNHGAFGSPFKKAFLYSEEIRRKIELNPVKFFDRDLFPYLAKAIVKLANFLNCDPLNLMPLSNATSGLNSIFKYLSKDLKKVICFDITYSATLLICEEYLIPNTAKIEVINIPLKFLKSENQEILINYITDSIPNDADLIVLDHISSQSCILLPLKDLISSIRKKFLQLEKNNELIILVDGAHAPGSVKINIDELNTDFYVGNLHKWLCSPRGGGFIYISNKNIGKIKGAIVSHGHANKNNLMDSFYWDGNRDYSAFISIIKTLEIWEILEPLNIYDHLKNQLKLFVDFICSKLFVSPLFSVDLYNSTMALIPLPEKYQKFTSKAIQDWLHYEYKIEITIKTVYEKNCMRISVHLYNELEEIEKLIKVLLDSEPII